MRLQLFLIELGFRRCRFSLPVLGLASGYRKSCFLNRDNKLHSGDEKWFSRGDIEYSFYFGDDNRYVFTNKWSGKAGIFARVQVCVANSNAGNKTSE
jgi:hypothetical protein